MHARTIRLRHIPRDDVHLIRDLDIPWVDPLPKVERLVVIGAIPADVRDPLLFNTPSNRVSDRIRVRQSRKLRRSKEGVAN
jgi:hypothetical protein